MSVIEDPSAPANLARVEPGGSVRVTPGIVGDRYCQGNITGVIAAALGANAAVYAMRSNPGTARLIRINRIRMQFTTIVAFTTPVTAGRRLAIFRGAGAAASGGTALGVSTRKDTLSPASQCDTAQGGDQRIASTGALTVTGITFDATPFRIMSLAHVGAAGNYMEQIFEFDDDVGGPMVLRPGEVMAIRSPVAMDAAGTWQLGVNVDWTEMTELP